MTTNTTTEVLKIQDQFSQPLQKYANELQRATSASKQFEQSTGSFGSSLRKGAADMFYMVNAAQQFYQVTSGVFRQADEWAQVGIAAERNKIALQSLTGTGAEYERQVNAIIGATRGMVTAGDAAGYAYRLQRFGLADTAAEMEKFMRTVSIVSAINPQLGGTAEAINQIQLTLSNMSYMRLDQLGVFAGQVRARIAELKATTRGLSDEQAFSTAVMEQLDQQANAVGDSILGMNDAQERMQARWRGFKEDWGLKIATGFEAIAEAAEGSAAAIDKVGAFSFILKAGLEIGKATGAINVTAPLTPEQQAARTTAVGTGFGQGYNIQEAPTVRNFTAANYAAYLQMANGQYFWRPGTPETIKASYRGVGMNYNQYYARQVGAQPWTNPEQWGRRGGAISNIAGTMGTELQEYYQRIQQYQANAPAPTERIGMGIAAGTDFAAAEQQLAKMARSSQEVSRNLTGAAQEWSSLNEKFGIAPKAFDTDVYSEMSSVLNEVGVSSEQAERAMTAYQLATGMATGSSLVFDNQLNDLTRQFADGLLSVDEYTQRVMDLGQMDLSWVDRYAAQMRAAGQSTDEINTAMQTLSDNWQRNFAAQGKGVASAKGAEGGGEAEGGDPFYIIQRSSEQALTSVQTFSSESQVAFTEFSSVATENVGIIEDALSTLDGRAIHVTAIVDIQTLMDNELALPAGVSHTGGNNKVPGRAGGGSVVGGGLYKITEGEIPEIFEGASGGQYLLAPRGGGRVIAPGSLRGGGSGPQTIVIYNVTDKQVTSKQVVDVARLRGNKS